MRKLAVLLTTFLSVKALASAPILFEGTDISPAVDFFAQQIRTVKTPFTTYNWSTSEALGDGEASYKYLLTAADGYWKSYGAKENQGNVYGFGLYTAVDPIVTQDYGKTRFLLREITFPAGLRILEMYGHGFANDINGLQNVRNAFSCPSEASIYLFDNGGRDLEPSCRRLVIKIFRDILNIDAFSYSYLATEFPDCEQNYPEANRAFVITRASWLRPDLVHLYTQNTRKNIERRAMIQTLFYQESQHNPNLSALRHSLHDHLKYEPRNTNSNFRTVCAGNQCSVFADLCEIGQCQEVRFLTYAKDLMTENSAIVTSPGKLLWPDLEGRPKVDAYTVRDWLQSNIHGCSGKSPYQEKEGEQ